MIHGLIEKGKRGGKSIFSWMEKFILTSKSKA
jgi:hypothetical protein